MSGAAGIPFLFGLLLIVWLTITTLFVYNRERKGKPFIYIDSQGKSVFILGRTLGILVASLVISFIAIIPLLSLVIDLLQWLEDLLGGNEILVSLCIVAILLTPPIILSRLIYKKNIGTGLLTTLMLVYIASFMTLQAVDIADQIDNFFGREKVIFLVIATLFYIPAVVVSRSIYKINSKAGWFAFCTIPLSFILIFFD